METQLNALATLSVLARTVSGCWNSAFLGLERNRSAVGKTKAPLVAGGPQQLTPPTPYSPFLLCRTTDDGKVEIRRVLHDGMDLTRHSPVSIGPLTGTRAVWVE